MKQLMLGLFKDQNYQEKNKNQKWIDYYNNNNK